jgi:cysteine synthase B
MYVSQQDAEEMCRRLAREEGIFAGISAAGACWVAQLFIHRCISGLSAGHLPTIRKL